MAKEEDPRAYREKLLAGNMPVVMNAAANDATSGESLDDLLVLVLGLDDPDGSAIAELLKAHTPAASKALPSAKGACIVTTVRRAKFSEMMRPVNPELADLIKDPPPAGTFAVCCVSQGSLVRAIPLPMAKSATGLN